MILDFKAKFQYAPFPQDAVQGAVGSFAEIIIPLALPKNYTWIIPDHLKEQVRIGCRVEVNLGKNKKYEQKKENY